MKKFRTKALLLVSAAGLAVVASLGKNLFNATLQSTPMQGDDSTSSLSKNPGNLRERAKPGGFDAAEQLLRSTQSSKLWADYRASKVGNAKAGSEILGRLAQLAIFRARGQRFRRSLHCFNPRSLAKRRWSFCACSAGTFIGILQILRSEVISQELSHPRYLHSMTRASSMQRHWNTRVWATFPTPCRCWSGL